MTFRSLIAVTLVAMTACGKTEGGARKADSQTAAGVVSPDSAGAPSAAPRSASADPANHNGKIPVLEYHVIGGEKNSLYTRTVASFKADLEDVYKRGYRPITIAQMLEQDF